MKIVIAMTLGVVLVSAATAQAQRPARRPAATAGPGSGWRIDTTRSEMTDELIVMLSLDAVNKVQGTLFEVRPTLAVRCRERELAVIVSTSAVLDADDDMTPVRLRWGTEPPEEERWSRSTDYTAAFAPDPEVFLGELLNVPDLKFEFHPYDATPRVAIFNARGLARHIPKLRAACPQPAPSKAPSDTELVLLKPNESQVFMESVVGERPEFLSGPQLTYPALLRQAGVQGRVLVQAVLDTLGRAEPWSVKVISSPNPGFDEPARGYVLGAMFRPARIHRRAVRVLINLPIDFKVKRTQSTEPPPPSEPA